MNNETIKEKFLHLILEAEAIKFGDFTTKSGRQSPYFLNFGCFNEGRLLSELAQLYAEKLMHIFPKKEEFYLYGAAYKGIPLAVATSLALHYTFHKKAFYTFNRKEIKTHGETGNLVGYAFRGGEDVILIDDVLTGGVSARESIANLKNYGVKGCLLLVGVDRQELGSREKNAGKELEEDYSIKTQSLLTIREIITLIQNDAHIKNKLFLHHPNLEKRIEAYLNQYCPKS